VGIQARPLNGNEVAMLDSNRLDGKVALITGAGGEIGAAAARLMLARGARVIAVDRDKAALGRVGEELSDKNKLVTIEGDVTDEVSVRNYVAGAHAAFGRIDVFFNNAGVEGPVRPITEYALADFERVLRVNVVGVFLGMKHVIPLMAAHGSGVIINTSSTAGLSGTRGVSAYNASKHAVIGLTRSAAAEWAAKGIRILAISPGPITSRMMSSLEDGLLPGHASEMHKALASRIPAGRYGTPEEVAALVAFLASDDARYILGGVLAIDGGLTAH
jgi:NAD(P)-dependent dehydrogenase (short-subunit alcohol dehydrogenase family)